MYARNGVPLRDLMPALYTIKLIEVLDTHGESTRHLARRAGIKNEILRNPEQLIHIPRYLSLLEMVLAETEIAGLGLQVGQRTTLPEHGILGYALLSSPNLREALQRIVRYNHLTGCLLHLELLEHAADTRLRMSTRSNWTLSEEAARYLTEEFTASLRQLGESVGLESSWLAEATLTYREPSYSSLYLQYLGCPVSFAQHEAVMTFRPAILDREIELANTQINAMCETECELLSQDFRLNAGLTEKIHRFLAFSPGKTPTMDQAAQALSTSTRTLRRHLHRENTTYQQVVSAFRLALAKGYLMRTALPASEIAYLVGYSEPVNFYRAFKQRFQLSTKGFRQSFAS